MDELTRFAQRLVERLAARPEGAQRPVSLAEVRERVLPYRAQRRALGLESVEDYETVLLRLVAEERGIVRTTPPAAAERARAELAQSNPDLSVLGELGEATLQLTSLAAGKIVGDPIASAPSEPRNDSHDRIASVASEPRNDSHDRIASAASEPPNDSQAAKPVAELCAHCETPLPTGRQATFCPWCGERVIPLTCSRCGTELEPEWRHCITCGLAVPDPYRTA